MLFFILMAPFHKKAPDLFHNSGKKAWKTLLFPLDFSN